MSRSKVSELGGRALALGLACALTASPAGAARPTPSARAAAPSPECRGSASPTIDAFQLLELQISYTTLLARYYLPVDPKVVVAGAHDGMEALLKRCGVVDRRPPRVHPRQDGGEIVDTDFLTILTHYGRKVDAAALVREAIAGEMAAMHDPYTEFFRPTEYEAFNTFLRGERFGGLGLVLDDSRGRPRVATVILGAPAEKAGVRSGDEIVSIDGVGTAGKSTTALRDLLRGRVGTVAHVRLERETPTSGGANATELDTLSLDITRAVVRDPQTISRLLVTGVGYVQLTRFGDDAAGEVARAIADLERRGATAFVLDLRDDGGGYGDAATGVASIFVSSGTIYSTRERTGAPVLERARGGSTFHAPLVVLVNHDTASASEIVAGALQDDRAATIVGARTFGKGVVQSVFPLPDGAAIKMTTARYFTPSGRSIDRVGIVPDVEVAEPADAHLGDPANDPQLAKALAILAASATPAATPQAAATPSASPLASASPGA